MSPTKRIDPKELAAGTDEEMEHTSNPKTAQRIALDHLEEPDQGDYYERLDAVGLLGPQARKDLYSAIRPGRYFKALSQGNKQ